MRLISLIILFFITTNIIFAQQKKYTINGYIRDIESGEELIGASINVANTATGTITNTYGYYSLTLEEGNYNIIYSFLGYNPVIEEMFLSENKDINIVLKPASIHLHEVAITYNKQQNPIDINEYKVETFTIKTISKLPTIFGENDIIKALQLQTGVKTTGDGSSGLYVRGGGLDQNLILIDEAPVYNPSHLFGLISIFNPDAVKNVNFYKSSMPANYGGRISSVIDSKMNEGNMHEFKLSGGISLFASRLTIEAPIIEDKASFFISARNSYINAFIKPGPKVALVPAFYDLNVKINYRINQQNRVFFSIYKGGDRLESYDGFNNMWGNTTATFRYNHIFTRKLFANFSLIYSNYYNNLEFTDNKRNFSWLTGIEDISTKADFTWYINTENKIKFGENVIYHQFIPGETKDSLKNISRSNAMDYAVYILHDINLSRFLGLNYGLRWSVFQNIGKASWFKYDENNLPIEKYRNISGVYNSYQGLEPRVSLNVKLNKRNSVKAAYSRTYQYMQLLQNNSLSYTSLETWMPANPNIKPQYADMSSIGWFSDMFLNYSFSIEAYYKLLHNQLDYIDHAKLLNNPYIEAEIRTGKARGYGIEALLQKNEGQLTGSISYNWSRIIRNIKGINGSNPYPAQYDIPHDFRITGNYKTKGRWKFCAIWMYSSGRPVTLPSGYLNYERKYKIPIYTDRNTSRFPAYHRFDISATLLPKSSDKKFKGTLNIGIYNLYARQNPLGYEFKTFYDNPVVYQYTFFTFFPNISYNFKF